MGKLLERLKRGREKLRSRVSQTKAKLEIKAAVRQQKREGEKAEAEAKFEKRIQEFEKRQERINRVREIQLKKARLESKILKEKAQKAKSLKQIRGPLPKLTTQGPMLQATRPSPGGALMDFGVKKKVIRKKQAPNRALGRFRVL